MNRIDWKLIAPVNCTSFSRISSERFQSLLASDRKTTLYFFLSNLKEIIKPNPHPKINIDQINYMAKFLTRFSLTMATPYLPPQKPLSVFFPTFESLVEGCSELSSRKDFTQNTTLLEWVACQMLLLSGFYFEDAIQTFDRSEIEKLGKDYFLRISKKSTRKKLFNGMAKNFRLWQDFLCYLRWHFQKMRQDLLVIKAPKPKEPLIKLTGK